MFTGEHEPQAHAGSTSRHAAWVGAVPLDAAPFQELASKIEDKKKPRPEGQGLISGATHADGLLLRLVVTFQS